MGNAAAVWNLDGHGAGDFAERCGEADQARGGGSERPTRKGREADGGAESRRNGGAARGEEEVSARDWGVVGYEEGIGHRGTETQRKSGKKKTNFKSSETSELHSSFKLRDKLRRQHFLRAREIRL